MITRVYVDNPTAAAAVLTYLVTSARQREEWFQFGPLDPETILDQGIMIESREDDITDIIDGVLKLPGVTSE